MGVVKQKQYDVLTNHLSVEDSPAELKKALQVLNDQFDSTARFTISSYWVSNNIPEINRKAAYSIFFTYYLNADTTKEYFSKLVPYEKTYKIEVFNGTPELDANLKEWEYSIENAIHKAHEKK